MNAEERDGAGRSREERRRMRRNGVESIGVPSIAMEWGDSGRMGWKAEE